MKAFTPLPGMMGMYFFFRLLLSSRKSLTGTVKSPLFKAFMYNMTSAAPAIPHPFDLSLGEPYMF